MSRSAEDFTCPIRVGDLCVRYGRRTAVDGVSFDVPQGSVYALLGRNGATARIFPKAGQLMTREVR